MPDLRSGAQGQSASIEPYQQLSSEWDTKSCHGISGDVVTSVPPPSQQTEADMVSGLRGWRPQALW